MFAIGFDLVVEQTRDTHPKGASQAYADIGDKLNRYGFSAVLEGVGESAEMNKAKKKGTRRCLSRQGPCHASAQPISSRRFNFVITRKTVQCQV